MENNCNVNQNKIVQINEGMIKNHLNEMVRSTVEDTLNQMLDAEAQQLCNAEKYERTEQRRDRRAGFYNRGLHTSAGPVTLKVPKLRQGTFETAIIERYRRREASVEEALIEMYLAGVSVRRIEDVTEALWGTRVSPSTVSQLNQKIYKNIEAWRNLPLEKEYPYVYLDGMVLKRCWAGEVRNVSILVAIGVGEDGYRKVLGIAEGAKEDKASWSAFLKYLKSRGLKGVKLFITDACMGLVESIADFYPDAKWQRCVVHFYRNVFSLVPRGKVQEASAMLKAIHAQENKETALQKGQQIIKKFYEMKLPKAAVLLENHLSETLSYYDFPPTHQRYIRTNNPLERIMKEIRRRTRVVGAFPDGHSALMLCAARLRHIAGTKWGLKKYLDMNLLKHLSEEMKEAC